MKKLNLIWAVSCLTTILALFSSCKSEEVALEEPKAEFSVLEVAYSSLAAESDGTITLDAEGVQFKSSDEWLEVSAVEGEPKKLAIHLKANDSNDSRYASVHLFTSTHKVRVPITQFGKVNKVVDLKDLELPHEGGTRSIKLELSDEPTVMVKPSQEGEDVSWVTYELKDGQLTLTIAPQERHGAERSALVTLTAGLLSETIEVIQQAWSVPKPTYEQILGDYVVEFEDEGKLVSLPVSLLAVEGEEEVILRGLSVDVDLDWDAKTGNLSVAEKIYETLLEGESLKEGQFLLLSLLGEKYEFLFNQKKPNVLPIVWDDTSSADAPVFVSQPVEVELKLKDGTGIVVADKFALLTYDTTNQDSPIALYSGVDKDQLGILANFTLRKVVAGGSN